MTTPSDSTAATHWRCPRCEAERAAEDDFCGRCGARRPILDATGARTDEAPAKGGFPVVRALVLNGVILAAVLVAVVLGRGDGGPTTIAFEPSLWRCDGSERTWIAAIPAEDPDLRLDWLAEGPAGQVLASSTTTRAALEPYRQADGTFRVSSSEPEAPECGLLPGSYTLTIRDSASNALVASGTVEIATAP